ncbi:MAG: hypothetical protein HOE48_22255 [Candidatus Latescibacteria bacterium]|jgi:hypothetical protein|nr:hypothetical protein [Candidatus Latescibacterota bacterium]MBT5829579.1 hypothetical protein [Candidatus Latescibacterota bacterium]
MNMGIPTRAFFQVATPCLYRQDSPKLDGKLGDWDETFLLPDLGGLDGKEAYANVYLAWNDRGLYFALDVKGKAKCAVDERRPLRGDGFQVWLDTRDVRTAHRGSRYCHHFCFWPESESIAAGGRQFRLRRARAQARLQDSGRFSVASKAGKEGYAMEVHIPADALTGFDPDENNRLGFSYVLKDKTLGRQFWTADETLPVSYDPSLWGTVELVK